MLADSAARWILVAHALVGIAAVGASTHLVIWLRRYVGGQYGRRHAVIRFAWIVLALQLGAFIAGNVMYPTYKVEVRAVYLENATAVTADRSSRAHELDRIAQREGGRPDEQPAAADLARRAAQAARWFDVKEHWVALGLLVSAALIVILSLWDPRTDGEAIVPVVKTLAWLTASTVWLGAIVGLFTAAWRAV